MPPPKDQQIGGKTNAQTDQHEHLIKFAEQTLSFFENTARAARESLGSSHQVGDPRVLANTNAITAELATQQLARIQGELVGGALQLAREPAIARIVIRGDDGKDKIHFITRGSTISSGTSGASMASYRSPIGRLAALRVGDDEEVLTPGGALNFQLRERAALRPVDREDGWDSLNTVLHSLRRNPLTIASLRQLLAEVAPEEVGYLDALLAADRAAENVREGIRRDVRNKMVLRDQPLLDQIQDAIFRLPLNAQFAVLGPPGTGKTTTLIKRLGLKLDAQFLEEGERKIVGRTEAGPERHNQSWMMFTPTELLKQYVKEAFALEGIAASDERIKSWTDYSRDIARNKLAVLRTDASNGPFVLRPTLDSFQPTTLARQISLFEDFEAWQQDSFWNELDTYAAKLTENTDPKVASLGKRLGAIIANNSSAADRFMAIATVEDQLQRLVNELRSSTDARIKLGLGKLFRQSPSILSNLTRFVMTLSDDSAEDVDDPDADEDEDHRRPTDRGAAIEACIRALRALARAAVSNRMLGKQTRHGRLIEYLGGKVVSLEELKEIGLSLQYQAAARRFVSPMGRYVSRISQRYRRFRRQRQSEGRWFRTTGFSSADISPLEVDFILLGMLRLTRELLRDARISRVLEGASLLKAIQRLFRTQIMVDEATDFSPIQLACMAALCDPAANSYFICGDFNQRITTWGTRSTDELKWAMPTIVIQSINISYRHSAELNELAHKIALLSDPNAVKTALPEDVINDGFKPVLATNLREDQRVADWLTSRIGEIERLTGSMPSIAVLVNSEEEVEPLAKALDIALADRSIRAVPCVRGQAVGQDNDVRVFDIQHIKGLEFESVFFVGVDDLATRLPDLFDKYLYVGTTRAATFLGLTTRGPKLPKSIASLEAQFQERWI